jgi:sec-independent protein translocase protein TatB
VFGLSFGELVVLVLVAMIVLGPKDIPRYLRKAGQFAGRLRRMAFDMREKSGIDEVLRAEGIEQDIAEIRRLARGEITGVVAAVRSAADPLRAPERPKVPSGPEVAALPEPATPAAPAELPLKWLHEYPEEGTDSYGALPDTSKVYDGDLPASPQASDPLYSRGEDSARAENVQTKGAAEASS